MASTVTIHEYSDVKRDSRGDSSSLVGGPLATDEIAAATGNAVPVKTVAAAAATDSDPLTNRTNFVVLRATALTYYRIRPKNAQVGQMFPATAAYPSIPANGAVTEAVYPGAIISFFSP